VHSPKIYYWLIHDNGFVVLKLFVSIRPLKLQGVLCIYVLLLHEGQAENHFAMFFYMVETHTWLWMFHYSWSFICVTFHVITRLLSFIVKIMSLMPCFKYFNLSTQCFTSLIKIVMVHVTSKIIVL
jgi:hypothetical protein